MKKSQIVKMPPFFGVYINKVADIELVDALKSNPIDHEKLLYLREIGDRVYAPDKWTVREILQHIIDNERIQSYRALRFARKDNTVLPGYDEQLFGDNAKASRRSLEDLAEEFTIVRNATIALYKSFTDTMLLQEGICFNTKISVLSLGFVIAGHQLHHFNIIEERYRPLLKEGSTAGK